MTDIELAEVSLVDYPAHLVSGFAVIKSADPTKDKALLSAFRKETMPVKDITEVLKGMSVEDVLKALTPEQVAELTKAKDAGDGDAEDIADGGADEDKEDENGKVVKAAVAEVLTPEDILKAVSPEVRAMIEKANADLATATAKIEKAEQDAEIAKAAQLDSEAVSFSKSAYINLGFDHGVVAPALRKFALTSPDAAEAITTLLKAVNTQTGGIFKELGTSESTDSGMTPYARLESLAKSLVSESVPFSKAFATVASDPANAALVTAHFNSKE